MEHRGYGKQITQAIEYIPYGEAFQTHDIANYLKEEFGISFDRAKTLTNIKLKRMADKNQIERLEKGVYFKVKLTPFGALRPSADQYITQILTKQADKIIGYESGSSFMNRLALTTLMPKNIEITTNVYRKKLPGNCHVIISKPVTEITDENHLYLQLLDTISRLPKSHIDTDEPEKLIRNYAQTNAIDILKLIVYARKYYTQKTLIYVIDIFTEDEKNEITRR